MVPIGHIQPQKERLEKININTNTAIIKKGNFPSAIEKNRYSTIPTPFERGFLGEFKIGNIIVDVDIMELAKKEAVELIANDPHFKNPDYSGLKENLIRFSKRNDFDLLDVS